MKKETKRMKLYKLGVWIFVFFLLPTGCARKSESNLYAETLQEEEKISEGSIVEDLQCYILLYSNPENMHLFLQSVETGKQEEFEYTGGTYLYNYYGDSVAMEQLETGELLEIKYTEKKVLTEVRVSEKILVYDNISNFKINMEKNIISIAGTNYNYDTELKVFSEDGIISLNEVSEQDTISVRAIDKKIITIVVTKGHGTVVLKNTKLFEGGTITVGNVFAGQITSGMTFQIPEGTYTLSVENGDYGDSMQLEMQRFKQVIVDLNTLKGQGPLYCQMKIELLPEDVEAEVRIDGEAVNINKAVVIRYGTHQITAEAEGYEFWSAKLVAASSQATVRIELKEEKEDTEDDSSEEETEKDNKENSSKEETEKDNKENSSKEETEKDNKENSSKEETEKDTEKNNSKEEIKKDNEKEAEKSNSEKDTEDTVGSDKSDNTEEASEDGEQKNTQHN